MANTTHTAQQLNAMRDELFRRIGAGEVVPESEWDVIADAQRALDDEAFLPSGYMRGLL